MVFLVHPLRTDRYLGLSLMMFGVRKQLKWVVFVPVIKSATATKT